MANLFPYPKDVKPEIQLLLGVLKGSGKLTDPADVHAAHNVIGFGLSKVYSDGSAPGTVGSAAPEVDQTHAAMIPHLEAGLLGGVFNWWAIIKFILTLLADLAASKG